MAQILPDFDEAQRHLALLAPGCLYFTFFACPESPATEKQGAPWQRCETLQRAWPAICDLQGKGYGIFVTANQTDATGRRKKKNIAAIRTVWQEADNLEARTNFPLAPHFTVCSSPGKFHRYFLTEPLTASTFDGLQQVMVRDFDSDKNATDVSRVLRLAGTWHQKATPHKVAIVDIDEIAQMCGPYTSETLTGAFGPLPERTQTPPPPPCEQTADELAHLSKALACVDNEDRGTWRDMGFALHHHTNGSSEGFELWDTWSSKSRKYQPDGSETQALWDSMEVDRDGGITINTLYKFAHASGFGGGKYQNPDDVLEGFAPVPQSLSAPLPKPAPAKLPLLRFMRPPTREESDNLKPLPHIIKGQLMRGVISSIVAPGAVGKSLLALQMAIAVALGDGSAIGMPIQESAKVLVLNVEDNYNMQSMRFAAVFQHEFKRGMFSEADRTKAISRIEFLLTGEDDENMEEFKVVQRDPKGAFEQTKFVEALIQKIIAEDIGVVIIDPFVSIHDFDENSNGDMQRVVAALRKIARKTKCAVLVIHHSKKPSGTGDGHVGNADAARGASAVVNATRITHTLFKMTEKDAEKYKIPKREKRRYVRLDSAKENYGLEGPEAVWYRKASIVLPNKEEVGVMECVELREATEQTGYDLLISHAAHLSEKPTSINAIATALLSSPMYDGESAPKLKKRIRAAFDASYIIYGDGFELHLNPQGATGGHIRRVENLAVTAH